MSSLQTALPLQKQAIKKTTTKKTLIFFITNGTSTGKKKKIQTTVRPLKYRYTAYACLPVLALCTIVCTVVSIFGRGYNSREVVKKDV